MALRTDRLCTPLVCTPQTCWHILDPKGMIIAQREFKQKVRRTSRMTRAAANQACVMRACMGPASGHPAMVLSKPPCMLQP